MFYLGAVGRAKAFKCFFNKVAYDDFIAFTHCLMMNFIHSFYGNVMPIETKTSFQMFISVHIQRLSKPNLLK